MKVIPVLGIFYGFFSASKEDIPSEAGFAISSETCIYTQQHAWSYFWNIFKNNFHR